MEEDIFKAFLLFRIKEKMGCLEMENQNLKIHYSFKHDELKLRISNIRVYEENLKKENIEKKAITILQQMDTYAILTSEFLNNEFWKDKFSYAIKSIEDKLGRPDLVAYDLFPRCNHLPNSTFCINCFQFSQFRFIEVKSINDSLRISQMVWLANHPQFPLEILILNIPEKDELINKSELNKTELIQDSDMNENLEI